MARRTYWGWGFEDEAVDPAAVRGLREHLGFGSEELETPAPLSLPEPRIPIPPELKDAATAADYDRARYGLGRSYLDVVRGLRGEIAHPPDFVVHAWTEDAVARTLEWAAERGVSVTPVGGGTSVVGGIEAHPLDEGGAIALALGAMDRVLEVDSVSRAARIQAGATGPRLEEQLAEQGLTLRFFPQSFELATLGGWIATRAGGHFATGPTHIDDLVEGVRAVTPGAGIWQSRRLPGSGAGPSPDRLLLGSEGTLAVITEAWVRVLERSGDRRSASVRVPDYFAGARAVRDIVQSGLRPSNCRVIDTREAALTFAGDGSSALLILGFETEPLDAQLERALAIAGGEAKVGGGGAGQWKDAFLRAPYLRDTLIAMGILSETFETAITWDRHDEFVEDVRGTAEAVLRERCGAGQVTVRMTHAYPDGAAPYFTCLAPVERGAEADTWSAVKHAASEAILRAGGTITHHHAVGRDHRPWYDRQRPEPFAVALRAAKSAVDPAGILNPGVLF